MSRWKALPAELDPQVRQLVVRLRRLKDHGGLSMRQLGARTGYSPKSWERYLNGRSLPPREAVEAMARISGDDPTRLLALHEVAAEAWEGRRGRASAPDAEATAAPDTDVPAAPETDVPAAPDTDVPAAPEPEDPPAEAEGARRHGRPLRIALVAGAVALLLAVSSGILLTVRLMDGDGDGGDGGRTVAAPLVSSPDASAPASDAASPPAYTCTLRRIDGRWYAGNSRTQDAIVGNGQAGPDVAEAQCLLRRAGFSPGGIDGIFGPLTERAVKRLQKRAGLVVDGIIGPHTWKALRR